MKTAPPSPDQDILPVKQSIHQTRQYYDRLSHWYDLLSGSTERKYTFKGLEMLDLQPGETVLEIGFGTGHALLRLAKEVTPDGRVLGIDLSAGMIAETRTRLLKTPAVCKTYLACGDAAHLPYTSAGVDAVFLSFTLELFDTPLIPAVLAECLRILRINGRLAVVALSRSNRPHLGVTLYEWVQRTFPGAVDCRPIPARFFIEQAGFQIIQTFEPALLGFLPLEIILGQKVQLA